MSSTTRTIETIKKDFPIFEANPSLVYLDSAATTQRPQCVIDAMHNFVTKHHANVHRGIYDLSIKASEQFDDARRTIAGFINAKNHEIIFTKNATEGFNLIAQSLLQHAKNVNKTEIALTQMEH
ncbi:MAG: aminotransferase class V-fold PLP-dependent enzyme, partial [Candidatus Woesearchaeota archaeon]